MRHPMSPEGEGSYWQGPAIGLTVLGVWTGFAVLAGKLTGYDGFRLSGWVIAAIGCGSAFWLWKKDNRMGALAALIYLGMFGIAIGLGRF